MSKNSFFFQPSFLIFFSLLLLVISFWNRNDFAEDMQLLPELANEPIQNELNKDPFKVQVKEREYFIEPIYDYEIYGLVVSYRLHDGDYGIHLRWGDYLNVADYCVVWGRNAFELELNKFKFWNREFTCYVQTNNTELWHSFDLYQLSNNHLITEDEYLRQQIDKIKIGDQIRLRGWLANYRSDPESPFRRSSTTRQDTGNGACETIYVKDVEILKSYTSLWRIIMYFSLLVFLSSLVWHFSRPFQVRE